MRCVRYSLQIKVLLGEVYSDSLIQGMVQLGWSSTSRSRVQEPASCAGPSRGPRLSPRRLERTAGREGEVVIAVVSLELEPEPRNRAERRRGAASRMAGRAV